MVSTVLVGLRHVGRPPFGELGPVATAGAIVALFGMASLAYWYDVRRWRRRSDDEPPDFLVSLGEEIPFEVRDEDGTINEDRTSDEDGTNDENETDDVDGTGEDDWQNDENT